MSKEKIEWPDELVILLRHPSTSVPILRALLYIGMSEVYIDAKQNLYHPRMTCGGKFIELTLQQSKDEKITVGHPIARDNMGDLVLGVMMGMGMRSEEDANKLCFSEEPLKSFENVRTVFRTAEAAHREWYRVLGIEKELFEEQRQNLEKWAAEHQVDLSTPPD
jgi:hypothetical protein